MKRGGRLLICLTGGLALCAIARAGDAVSSGNPYTSIITRNIFGLVPIPPPPPVQVDTPLPPKITLTGIMTIFGPREALFKVSGIMRPGKPPTDESYILTEGQEQDDVEVTHINEKKGMVTFNNHGVVQEIPLASGVASTEAMAAPTETPNIPQHVGPRPFGRPGGPGNFPGRFNPRQRNGFGPGNNGPGNYNPGNNDGSAGQPNGFNSFGQQNSYNNNNSSGQQFLPGETGDDQQALIAANHALALQQHSPAAAIYPPTKYDDDALQEVGGDSSGQPAP